MSTTLAIATATTASTTASISAANAARAKKLFCDGHVASYDSKTATVEQAKQYADCIQWMYPRPMSESGVLVIKVFIIAAIIGAVVGFAKGLNERYLGWPLICIGMPFLGAAVGAFAILLVFATYAGIRFLFL